MSENLNPTELREFERHALEFGVAVYTALGETKVLIERTALKDVSGGGMRFVSKRPDLYSKGQRIFLHICMPSAGEKDVGMECVARIAWMKQLQLGEAEEQQQTVVGVSIDSMLSFEKTMHDKGSGDHKPGQQP